MSGHTTIQDTSFELRQKIHAALADTPATDFGLSTVDRDIVLSPPSEVVVGPPLLSVYLYHIEPDPHLRNQPSVRTATDELRFPPLALQLHYLITGLEAEEDQNQLLLGRVLQHFHDNPILMDIGLPGSGAATARFQARITLEMLSLEELTRIRSALRSGFQLSLCYKVQTILVESGRPDTRTSPVREIHSLVGIRS